MGEHASNLNDFTHLKDEQIWLAFREGDKEVFSFIYINHIDILFNYGMKVIDDRTLVRDSIQELFIDLWKSRKNLSSTDNIRYYLFKVLRRRLIREVKKQRLDTEKYIQNYKGEIVVMSPENVFISAEISAHRKAILKKALGKISLRQQEVLNLLFFENYSYEQVSQLMAINVKSVYTLAWKAFSALRKSLKSEKL